MYSPNDNIQLALIGAGGMGQGDTKLATSLPGVKLVAACDCYDGRLERMHRDLKKEACVQPAADCRRQQPQFDRFVDQFNCIRPHEALGQTPPARIYERSSREYPKRLPEIAYPSSYELRRVRSSGEIKWKGQWFFLSESLVDQIVAFEDIDDDCSIIRFGPVELGYYSDREHRLHLDRTRPASTATASNEQPDNV